MLQSLMPFALVQKIIQPQILLYQTNQPTNQPSNQPAKTLLLTNGSFPFMLPPYSIWNADVVIRLKDADRLKLIEACCQDEHQLDSTQSVCSGTAAGH